TIGERLQPRGDDDLEWERLRDADGVYFTAGDTGALTRARTARVLTASPRGREAREDPAGPHIDALIFSDEDSHEREWAQRLESRTELMVATQGGHGGRWWGTAGDGRWPA